MVKIIKIQHLDVYEDHVMYELHQNVENALHILNIYMQKTTPYGKEYEAAFKQHRKIYKELEIYEGLLRECIDARGK